MKGLKWHERLIFWANIIVAIMLLLSYLLPYVQPSKFAFLSILSLGVPFLIILNLLFLIYWLIKFKKQLSISLLVLLIGYGYVFSLYKFSESGFKDDKENFKVMNFNVRLFNVFNWIENPNLKTDILSFIKQQQPDVISFQEYRPDEVVSLKEYYKYEELSGDKIKNGQAIFSKYKIINSGSIEFPNTSNNAIFADIIKDNDTIRIYNVHLQSMGIDPTRDIANEPSKNVIKRISNTFATQQKQAELFLSHKTKCPYKMIVCGDFNNTAYSYVYNKIKEGLNDTFVIAGKGFGRTLDFDLFPIRIDFILSDDNFEINGFETFSNKFSDHFPIMARLKLSGS